ncbi:multidrug ABC transporter [Ameyamaea chiangmaiensis NBRC 103196]|uniref:HlyD family secretion protein n=1 Tax=Ameyamaea chiangmaiensis TaxID=442969 RepID=A0A850PDX3_9PROT|nr:HlyD family secretion protein [Ameyamaea chiangmaiensis]MBS4074667.1 HlyD family secretion protein [Ameyamaea chiangmaiensis]NVN40889.1 HlyD family secretion protein [Ameyamaea chiangmaiensis]GBQ62297.1 multidrug ABC transporter [Ameyamaea chiangmaiensis NBRC 103196]
MPEDTQQSSDAEKRRPLVRIALILFLVLAILGGVIYWFLTRFDIGTDDAFTAGRTIPVASHVQGYVTELLVNDNQFVHKGQLLVRIDNRDYVANRDKAQAALVLAQARVSAAALGVEIAQKNYPGQLTVAQGGLAEAKANVFKAETDYRRQQAVARAATTQQDIDYARAALDAARAQALSAEGRLQVAEPVRQNIQNTNVSLNQQEAQLASARADLANAELNVGWTEIRAPHDGWISQRNVEQGTFLSVGQTMFSIVEPEVWVIANYKETQITRMRPGQPVTIDVDAYPSLALHGHVDSLQLGTGATFSAFPPENATGNYVKIVQRVPVKIVIDSGLDPNVPLPLGLSVEPTVDVQ